jgi:hypothetical protein
MRAFPTMSKKKDTVQIKEVKVYYPYPMFIYPGQVGYDDYCSGIGCLYVKLRLCNRFSLQLIRLTRVRYQSYRTLSPVIAVIPDPPSTIYSPTEAAITVAGTNANKWVQSQRHYSPFTLSVSFRWTLACCSRQ